MATKPFMIHRRRSHNGRDFDKGRMVRILCVYLLSHPSSGEKWTREGAPQFLLLNNMLISCQGDQPAQARQGSFPMHHSLTVWDYYPYNRNPRNHVEIFTAFFSHDLPSYSLRFNGFHLWVGGIKPLGKMHKASLLEWWICISRVIELHERRRIPRKNFIELILHYNIAQFSRGRFSEKPQSLFYRC